MQDEHLRTADFRDGKLFVTPIEHTVRIPIFGKVRSLNLSTAAGIVLYEALRQTGRLEEPEPGDGEGEC